MLHADTDRDAAPSGFMSKAAASQVPSATLRVVVIDDHTTLAELLAMALGEQDDVECVGHAATAEAGLELVASTRPDVVLMDFGLPDMDGVRATARLLADNPDTRVVMLTAATDPHLIAQAAAAGASAFVPKSGGLAEVLTAIRNARSGNMVVDASLLGAILDAPRGGPRTAAGAPQLTPREREVLQLLGLGLDVRRAAKKLGISMHTCRGHVKSLLAKFGCHSQLEAVVAATRLGLIDVPRDS
jgi:DNA-binding NarL/FixJ family response regulator